MTCKNCANHDKCKKQGNLMLTVNDICELMYQHGVEKSCTHFKKGENTCHDCIHNKVCEFGYWYETPCIHFKNKDDFVEVKHGEWEKFEIPHMMRCSRCGVSDLDIHRTKFAFCPYCGAKMDGQTPQKLNHNSLCETETYKVDGSDGK